MSCAVSARLTDGLRKFPQEPCERTGKGGQELDTVMLLRATAVIQKLKCPL